MQSVFLYTVIRKSKTAQLIVVYLLSTMLAVTAQEIGLYLIDVLKDQYLVFAFCWYNFYHRFSVMSDCWVGEGLNTQKCALDEIDGLKYQ